MKRNARSKTEKKNKTKTRNEKTSNSQSLRRNPNNISTTNEISFTIPETITWFSYVEKFTHCLTY